MSFDVRGGVVTGKQDSVVLALRAVAIALTCAPAAIAIASYAVAITIAVTTGGRREPAR